MGKRSTCPPVANNKHIDFEKAQRIDVFKNPRGSDCATRQCRPGLAGTGWIRSQEPRRHDSRHRSLLEQFMRSDWQDYRREYEAAVSVPAFSFGNADFSRSCFSHSHQDHVDPETIEPYLKAGGKGPFIAPHEAADRLLSLGVEDRQIRLIWPNYCHAVGDFILKATFAIPLGGDDLTHVGYLVEVRGGPRIYFTGDTDYNEILSLSVAPYRPDIMVTVINPAFRNLSPTDAARLAKAIGPKWVIPCHHDLFPDNSLPDRVLRTNLVLQGMENAFCPLRHGEISQFAKVRRGGKQPLSLLLKT
jgi:L-ascorbate metabolism protein UlaG (beta-lactamase superfamily)